MANDPLTTKKCKPCEGGVPPLTSEEVAGFMKETPEWEVDSSEKIIERSLTFRNFSDAMVFVNRVAEIAEEENHHPNILLHGYKHVTISLTTHAIDGLSENDFIVAAKIDKLI